MITREQDFREVRRLLGDPVAQRPTPDIIVSNMISAEQYLLNRMTGTGKAWTHSVLTFDTVIDQSTYPLVPISGPALGKVLFVYRDLGDGNIFPVPQTDFMSEPNDQRYQYWVMSTMTESIVAGERVAAFRNGNDAYIRFYPAPPKVHTYSVAYATGNVDWSTFEWSDIPVLPEFSRYRQLYAALSTLAKCQWEGHTKQENAIFRQELRADLNAEMQRQEAELTPYLRNPQHEPGITEVGYFWE